MTRGSRKPYSRISKETSSHRLCDGRTLQTCKLTRLPSATRYSIRGRSPVRLATVFRTTAIGCRQLGFIEPLPLRLAWMPYRVSTAIEFLGVFRADRLVRRNRDDLIGVRRLCVDLERFIAHSHSDTPSQRGIGRNGRSCCKSRMR